jgi:hypothetical protein
MKEYFAVLFVGAAVLSVIRFLGFKSSNIERLALGVICLYLIIAPIGRLGDFSFDDMLHIPEFEVDSGADAILEDAVSRGVKSAVTSEFGIRGEDISVRLFGFERETMTAEHIEIILSGAAVTADYRMVESFVNKMEIGETRVEISFGK